MPIKDYPGYFYKKIGSFCLVHWPKKVMREIAGLERFKRYNFSFTGIGVGGYYIGFLNGRLKGSK